MICMNMAGKLETKIGKGEWNNMRLPTNVKKKLIVTGNPVDGFDYYGPFDFVNADMSKIVESLGIETDWWAADVVGVEDPEENIEFVTLVGFGHMGKSPEDAQARLIENLKSVMNFMPDVECWWIAEDERQDRSDNNSAIFVPHGMTQFKAASILIEYGEDDE